MSNEAQELHRIISASSRDMLDAYRIQASAGPVPDHVVEAILFRAAHPIVHSFAPYPAEQRAALLPNVVRLMLAASLRSWRARTARRRHDDQPRHLGPARAEAMSVAAPGGVAAFLGGAVRIAFCRKPAVLAGRRRTLEQEVTWHE